MKCIGRAFKVAKKTYDFEIAISDSYPPFWYARKETINDLNYWGLSHKHKNRIYFLLGFLWDKKVFEIDDDQPTLKLYRLIFLSLIIQFGKWVE